MKNVLFLGLVSFFTDVSTEMVYPLIPLFLISKFGATPALIGLIEGIAESLASLLKVFSGYISDRFKRKKELAFAGYFAGLIYKVILLFANSWAFVLFARLIDRFGKGIRTAPRDSLVSESAAKNELGKAFGLHKAFDMAGAALGILITYFLIKGAAFVDYNAVFMISMIPAVLGLFMFVFIKQDSKTQQTKKREPFFKNIRGVDNQLWLYLFVVFVFTLGNSSKTFLLLKAKAVGFEEAGAILLYFVYNLTASALSFPAGRLSDNIGRKKLLVSGYIAFGVCYTIFALAASKIVVLLAFVVFGVYTAMITGVERAFVAEIAPPELKGTMLGLHSTVAGVALFPASLITGMLWVEFGAAVPFAFGAAMAFAAAALLWKKFIYGII
jgi:MFS family permease